MNASNKSRYVSSETAINQGGGNKKAGFPHIVGRDHWVSIYLGAGNSSAVTGKCCSLKNLQLTANPNVCASRPVGSTVQFNTYWKCPGSG
jgi:hypothetical protein